MKATNRTTGQTLAGNLLMAETPMSRTRGLLGRNGLPEGEGLLLRPCLGVHTFFMKFPIDLVFLDRRNRVVAAVKDLKPHRMTGLVRSASSVLELPAGTVEASGTCVGNEIEFG